MKTFRKAVNIFSTILLIAATAVVVFVFVLRLSGAKPHFFGYYIFNVASDSMTPMLQVGDVILVKECDGEDVHKGDVITYHGTAVYTVDLSKLSRDNITLDEEKQVVTLRIPHAQQEKINIPSDEITFGDVKKGILALGNMNVTPEDMAKVQTEAAKKMEEQLKNSHVIDEADRFAKMSVWEIYQPMVNKVTTGYSLEVLFEDE